MNVFYFNMYSRSMCKECGMTSLNKKPKYNLSQYIFFRDIIPTKHKKGSATSFDAILTISIDQVNNHQLIKFLLEFFVLWTLLNYFPTKRYFLNLINYNLKYLIFK